MYPRLIFTAFFVLVFSGLLAQPVITSITYQGNEAILTRNNPPPGIIYYWQGTSCGTLMNHSSSTTIATGDGTFYLRAFTSSGALWATSCASTMVSFPDLTPPVLSNVTPGPIEDGDPIHATSNENGMLYLVPDGTAANYSSIVANRVASAAATANVAATLITTGIGMGGFVVYAADGAHNVSSASPVITVTDLTAPILSDVTAGPVGVGSPIAATSNEDGTIFLVPAGTAANIGAIAAAQVAESSATAGNPVSLATSGIALGDYAVHAVDGYDNVSAASAVIAVVDLTAPILSDVTAGPIEVGTDILGTSNEDGMLYLVPDGTAPNMGDINAGKVAETAVSANVAGTLSTSGIDLGDYVVYAVDGSNNISAASPAITVTAATYIDLNNADQHQVQLYPVNVIDILHIRSGIPVASARVYALTGALVISIDTPTDRINMSALHAGIYIVNITLEDQSVFNGKVTKK